MVNAWEYVQGLRKPGRGSSGPQRLMYRTWLRKYRRMLLDAGARPSDFARQDPRDGMRLIVPPHLRPKTQPPRVKGSPRPVSEPCREQTERRD